LARSKTDVNRVDIDDIHGTDNVVKVEEKQEGSDENFTGLGTLVTELMEVEEKQLREKENENAMIFTITDLIKQIAKEKLKKEFKELSKEKFNELVEGIKTCVKNIINDQINSRVLVQQRLRIATQSFRQTTASSVSESCIQLCLAFSLTINVLPILWLNLTDSAKESRTNGISIG
jgi:hypothetical protein